MTNQGNKSLKRLTLLSASKNLLRWCAP